MKLHVLGIHLGKTVFHLVGLDSAGNVVIRKRCSRKQWLVGEAPGEQVLARDFNCQAVFVEAPKARCQRR